MSDFELGSMEPRLSTDERERVLATVDKLRAARRAELNHAIDQALEHVPRIFRGALKKVLFS
ncbi:MAG: hypothetical protein QM831_40430 [Kofleriaceae bacterium]